MPNKEGGHMEYRYERAFCKKTVDNKIREYFN
jgi:hypothetical protein